MAVFNCTECDARWVEDQLPRRGSICFKCHVKSIRLGFTYGKDDFHGPTVRERAQKQISEAKAAGLEPQYAGKTWV